MPVWFDVRSAAANYSVVFEKNVFAVRAGVMRDGIVIADAHFASQLAAVGVSIISLQASETAKSLDALSGIVVQMREAGVTRQSHLWAIGGGVIQDIAGFIASIYMRGIDWTYVPTTLLGMVDSCIGGKSSINVGAYKNIVGTFHSPATVLIDPMLTATLSTEQRIAGLAEAAKICYCRGSDVFLEYLALGPGTALRPDRFEAIIELSLRAKKWFVEIDEFDRSERMLLNLGHTFGHALEGASGYRLSHGIAVGVGIMCASALTRTLMDCPLSDAARRLEGHICALLAGWPELRGILKDIDLARVFDHIEADKKHEAQHYRFITFDKDGRVQITRLLKGDESRSLIIAALHKALESLCH